MHRESTILVQTVILVAGAFVTTAMLQERAANVEITGHVVSPERLDPSPERLKDLRTPKGFRVEMFAQGLGHPRILAVADDGTVYVTRRESGDVVMLRDLNGDGRADDQQVVARRPMLHGIAIQGDRVYLAGVKDIYTASIQPDGHFTDLERIVRDLPDGGQHPNRTLAVGPDGMLYVSVGSSCNACAETNPDHATLLQMSADGQSRRIFASGLRNTIGFDWHPETLELFGMDHGIDWLGDNEQLEELNRLREGKQYGWPYVYGRDGLNAHPEPPGGIATEQWARISEPSVLGYTAHAAPMQMRFYTGSMFPPEYRHDAFVAMRGSWNRRPPSGYEVVRVRFDKGKPTAIEPFVTGFLVSRSGGSYGSIGRPVGLAVAKDGALLVSDDSNGVIYRVFYDGGAT